MHFIDIRRAQSWLDGYNNKGLVGRLSREGQLTIARRCCDLHQLHGAIVRHHQIREVIAGLEELVILVEPSWMHCFIFSDSEQKCIVSGGVQVAYLLLPRSNYRSLDFFDTKFDLSSY